MKRILLRKIATICSLPLLFMLAGTFSPVWSDSDKAEPIAPYSTLQDDLLEAIDRENVQLVGLLLKAGANPDRRYEQPAANVGFRSATPFYLAVWSGDRALVAELLAAGADVNVVETETCMTPLMVAAREGYFDIVRLLLENGADVNARYCWYRGGVNGTALGLAAEAGHLDIVCLLLDFAADPNIKDNYWGSPTQRAARSDRVEVLRLLLARGGVY